jgi:hypothetical protein
MGSHITNPGWSDSQGPNHCGLIKNNPTARSRLPMLPSTACGPTHCFSSNGALRNEEQQGQETKRSEPPVIINASLLSQNFDRWLFAHR